MADALIAFAGGLTCGGLATAWVLALNVVLRSQKAADQ